MCGISIYILHTQSGIYIGHLDDPEKVMLNSGVLVFGQHNFTEFPGVEICFVCSLWSFLKLKSNKLQKGMS